MDVKLEANVEMKKSILLGLVLLMMVSSVSALPLPTYWDFESCTSYYNDERAYCYEGCSDEACYTECDDIMRTAVADYCTIEWPEFCGTYGCSDFSEEDCPDCPECTACTGGSTSVATSTLEGDCIQMGYTKSSTGGTCPDSTTIWKCGWWLLALGIIIGYVIRDKRKKK